MLYSELFPRLISLQGWYLAPPTYGKVGSRTEQGSIQACLTHTSGLTRQFLESIQAVQSTALASAPSQAA